MENFAEGLKYIGNLDQLCYARCDVLEEGSGRGQRVVDVCNGTGLAFTVTPDRCMNLVECTFNGVPLVFRTPGGHRHCSGDWLRDWAGGLVTTCGLRNAGSPSGDEGLHGRISSCPAENLCVKRDANGNIEISGTMREGALFSENLHLDRTIRTAYGDNRIVIDDVVTNWGQEPEYIEILYHCNFGWPFVSPALQFVAPEHKVEPRDDWAASALDEWNKLPEPIDGFREMCYRHYLPADEKSGLASMKLVNQKVGVAVTISYDVSTLPLIVQWKNCATRGYVLGMEPTCASLNGREADIAAGIMPKLACGESRKFHFEIAFETSLSR